MKTLFIAVTVCIFSILGCSPSDQPAPAVESTPTVAAGDEITEMDFETGEVDQPETESEEPAEEPTPDVP